MDTINASWSLQPVKYELYRLGKFLWRRRAAFLIGASVPLMITLAYVAFAPDRYLGKAKVIVSIPPADTGLDLTGRWTLTSHELENQLELVKSHEVLSEATAAGRRLLPNDPPSESELARALKVKPVKGTDIIEVAVEARSAHRAAALANLVADAYMLAHVRDRRKSATTAKEFIEDQLAIYEKRLAASEKALEDYKKRTGLRALPLEAEEMVKAEAAFERELATARVELAVAQERRAYLEKELRDTRARLLDEAPVVSSPVARELQEKLVALEVRYASLALKGYSANHAELVALAEEIEQTRRKLTEEVAAAAAHDTFLNPFEKIEKVAKELDAARADEAALAEKERRLSEAVAATSARLADLPGKELALARLQREAETNESIYKILLEKREEARIAEASEVGVARIFSRATPPTRPFAPRRLQSILLGLIMAFSVGSMAAGLVNYFDRSVRSVAIVKEVTQAPVVGIIPAFDQASAGRGRHRDRGASDKPVVPLVVAAPKSPPAEAFRSLYAQLTHIWNTNGAGPIAFGVTSARAQEGKSTLVSNLGVIFAEFGHPTLLIDADLERAAVTRYFRLEGSPGVRDFVIGKAQWEDVVRPLDINGMKVLPAGRDAESVPGILASANFGKLLERAKEEHYCVIVDVPPVFPVADVPLVAPKIKKFLFVVRSGVTTPQELERGVHIVSQVGGEIVGVILNAADVAETYGYSYYHYNYYYRDGDKDVRRRPLRRERSSVYE